MDKSINHYSSEFKMKTVLLSLKSNNIAELARDLNIRENRLHEWRRLYREFGSGSFPGSGNLRVHPEKQRTSILEKKLTQAKMDLEILKKGQKYIYKDKADLYNFIKQHEGVYPIKKMCRMLGAGLTTYKTWKKQPLTKTQKRVLLLRGEITSIYYENKQCHGAVLITRELIRRGFQISECQVSFHMKQLGLKRKIKRKFKVTTDSNHNMHIAPNILNRNFKAEHHSKVSVSDITYIQTEKCFLYLTVIMDLYDRKIIGWNLDYNLTAKKTILPAFEMALKNRQIANGLVFHSDRGVQYANKHFTEMLDFHKCIRSMSRTGDHLDNAAAESFFNSLKRELIHPLSKLLSTEDMKREIFEFIEIWYNKKRMHSSLNYKTIPEFNANYPYLK